MKLRPLSALAAALLVTVAGGANCSRMVRQASAPTERLLPANPTLEQVVSIVNQNGQQIRSLSSNEVSISLPGLPSLSSSSISAERIRKFRLRASGLLGQEADIGSNDELFWIWVKRQQPPSLFFCRHDQFASSAARQIMPVEPEWLFEALGAATFDPSERHEGPTPTGQGRLQIRSSRQSALGELIKVTVVDEVTGWVVEQHLYDPKDTSRPLASSFTSDHRRDPLTGLTMPRLIELQYPSAAFTMKIAMNDLRINMLQGDPALLWAKPEIPGYANVDLADPNLRFLQPNQQVQLFPTGAEPAVTAADPNQPKKPWGRFSALGWFQ